MIENTNMAFRVKEDRLHANQDIKYIIATNGTYEVTVFYYGDYDNDKENNSIDISLTGFSCAIDGIHPPLYYTGLNGTISIRISEGETLYISKVDDYKRRIDIAKYSALALVEFLKSYGFPAEI